MSELAELLERFRRGPELLAVATTGAAGSELDFKPGEGKWSVRQIACHLADSEAVACARFRQLLAEQNPTFLKYDQNAWAAGLDYERRKISQALEMFRMLRSGNYDLLKDQPAEAFERSGTHSERGRVTLLEILRIMAEHAEKHVKQIQIVRAAYREHKAKSVAQ
jgi:hypothetical protein